MNMQIIVTSDNHGFKEPMDRLLQLYPDAKYFLHCGDSELPEIYLSNYYVVKGNNDHFYDYPEYIILDLNENFRALIIHGHRHIIYKDLSVLANFAKSKECNVCFYGHTHIFNDEIVEDIRMINPGSIIRCRDFTPGCYALINIDKNKLYCQRINL